jgi:predicted ArsR family transcriptional regulator
VARIIDFRHTSGVKFPSPGAERVARALHDAGPSTAAGIAAELGLSGAVVRRHLDSLVRAGMAVSSQRPPFGPTPQRGRGRPARTFALTDAGSHAFDVAYDDLAVSALRYLHETGGDELVTAFARTRAQEWSARHEAHIQTRDGVEERVAALVGVLTQEGYAASFAQQKATAAHEVCQHHCPVAHVAAEFPQLCEAETLAFEQMLGTHVLRIATIAHGDGVCTTLIPTSGGSPSMASATASSSNSSITENHVTHRLTKNNHLTERSPS